MPDQPAPEIKLLHVAYAAFNTRDIDEVHSAVDALRERPEVRSVRVKPMSHIA